MVSTIVSPTYFPVLSFSVGSPLWILCLLSLHLFPRFFSVPGPVSKFFSTRHFPHSPHFGFSGRQMLSFPVFYFLSLAVSAAATRGSRKRREKSKKSKKRR
jgi:hypothetical protein